jgi:hypothetical protein
MPEQDDKNPFEGRTFLLIRDHLQDDGTEPLPSALPAWLSPDIAVVKPDGTRGGEAQVGVVNQVEVTVRNRGGINAVGTWVDAYFASSATGFTPVTAALIGGSYVDVPGYGMATVSLPWNPPATYAGHGCILARASLIIPPDSYADPNTFDVRGDRHVGQRNIEVIQLTDADESAAFAFNLVNTLSRPARIRVEVREVRGGGDQQAIRAVLGCGIMSFAERPLERFGLRRGESRVVPGRAAVPIADVIPAEIPVARLVRLTDMAKTLICELDRGEVCEAVLHVARNRDARPGDVHALEIRQFDERDGVMGGLTVLVRH